MLKTIKKIILWPTFQTNGVGKKQTLNLETVEE